MYATGYYRDYDQWFYVESDGTIFVVTEPGVDEPVWIETEPPLGDDAVPAVPSGEELRLFRAGEMRLSG
jgi:hypothetical protein